MNKNLTLKNAPAGKPAGAFCVIRSNPEEEAKDKQSEDDAEASDSVASVPVSVTGTRTAEIHRTGRYRRAEHAGTRTSHAVGTSHAMGASHAAMRTSHTRASHAAGAVAHSAAHRTMERISHHR